MQENISHSHVYTISESLTQSHIDNLKTPHFKILKLEKLSPQQMSEVAGLILQNKNNYENVASICFDTVDPSPILTTASYLLPNMSIIEFKNINSNHIENAMNQISQNKNIQTLGVNDLELEAREKLLKSIVNSSINRFALAANDFNTRRSVIDHFLKTGKYVRLSFCNPNWKDDCNYFLEQIKSYPQNKIKIYGTLTNPELITYLRANEADAYIDYPTTNNNNNRAATPDTRGFEKRKLDDPDPIRKKSKTVKGNDVTVTQLQTDITYLKTNVAEIKSRLTALENNAKMNSTTTTTSRNLAPPYQSLTPPTKHTNPLETLALNRLPFFSASKLKTVTTENISEIINGCEFIPPHNKNILISAYTMYINQNFKIDNFNELLENACFYGIQSSPLIRIDILTSIPYMQRIAQRIRNWQQVQPQPSASTTTSPSVQVSSNPINSQGNITSASSQEDLRENNDQNPTSKK